MKLSSSLGSFRVTDVINFGNTFIMKKKECPSCAMMIDEKSKVCPICQYEFPARMGATKWIAIALVILLVFYLILGVI
jgi:RNA polymerase subunit RPABC4/transcription elongation factor Spt4